MLGTKLGDRYEIVAELGRGGMGVVYFLMPVVQGKNLRAVLKEAPRRLGELLDIIIQVADAMEYSHARGIIHRDIKPENIMVSEETGTVRVWVMDFGLARSSGDQRLTKTGTLIGTVVYFSPEQVLAREIDNRSNIYSLGTVFYEALAGEPPFTGEMQAVVYRVVHEIPRSLQETGVGINPQLEAIIERSMAKDPAKRYQRAGGMAEDLRRYQATLKAEEKEQAIVLTGALTAHWNRPAASPFVGREKEFAELQRKLNAAVDGEAQFVVVAGEPGIGKSRLLEELENLAHAKKVRVLHGRFAEQSQAFAYQAFRDVIQEYFRSTDSSSASGERPDFSDLAPDLISVFPLLSEVSAIRPAASVEAARGAESRKGDDRSWVYETHRPHADPHGQRPAPDDRLREPAFRRDVTGCTVLSRSTSGPDAYAPVRDLPSERSGSPSPAGEDARRVPRRSAFHIGHPRAALSIRTPPARRDHRGKSEPRPGLREAAL